MKSKERSRLLSIDRQIAVDLIIDSVENGQDFWSRAEEFLVSEGYEVTETMLDDIWSEYQWQTGEHGRAPY